MRAVEEIQTLTIYPSVWQEERFQVGQAAWTGGGCFKTTAWRGPGHSLVIGGPFFWSAYKRDFNILGSVLWARVYGNPQINNFMEF